MDNDSKTEYRNHDFAGDTMDQRAFINYTASWLKEGRRVVKQEGVCAAFIDWRQLPAMTDCFQMSGWIWRGIAVWNKPSSRPQKGRFRAQAEYIVWGSKGALPLDRNSPVLPGVFTTSSVPSKSRIHQTQKPLDLMRQVVKLCEKGERIFDPFAGSGTTILAAELEGFDSLGIELDDYYAAEADKRIKEYLSTVQQTV
ncbi:DNA-methyltransferase [Sporolactobacillus shoreae]|uniref:DNA-methyltransferase n=1 Tax=Sporolactobacillus shoreae TaxID=1465501 RepID=UPI00240DE3E7|nr:site-specific DNA-methyltransferase [Sporolactobacillus shoreae]